MSGGDSVPKISALAQLLNAFQLPSSVLVIRHPAQSLSGVDNQWLRGLRLVALDDPSDAHWWYDQLDQGLPCFSLGHAIHVWLNQTQTTQASCEHIIMALAYGLMCCGDLPFGWQLDEHRQGLSWSSQSPVEVSYLVRDSFEARREQGTAGSWADQDMIEAGLVRLEVTHPGGRLWTQPRWIG